MLLIKNLSKSLNGKQVLSNVNLGIAKGSVYGITGDNESGKSTLLRTIAGIYQADSGSILYKGQDLINNHELKHRIGYISDTSIYCPNHRIRDLIDLYQRTYKHWEDQRYAELRVAFNLNPKTKIKHLSKGMITRLALLLNLAIKPTLLLLDEPTLGLDTISKKLVLEILKREAKENKTTMLIVHSKLNEFTELCDYIGTLRNGEIEKIKPVKQVKAEQIKIQVCYKEDLPQDLCKNPNVINIKKLGSVYYLTVNDNIDEVMAIAESHNPIILNTISGNLSYELKEVN